MQLDAELKRAQEEGVLEEERQRKRQILLDEQKKQEEEMGREHQRVRSDPDVLTAAHAALQQQEERK